MRTMFNTIILLVSGLIKASFLVSVTTKTNVVGATNCTEFNPCKNMADCLRFDNDPARVKCVCQRGFSGNLCEIWPKICSEDFCFNGGTCVLIKRIPRCLCQPSYNGLFCERNSFQTYSDMMAATPVPGKNQFVALNPAATTTLPSTTTISSTPSFASTQSTSTISYLTLHPSIYLTSNLNRPKLTICDFDPCLNFGQCLPITDRKSFYKFQCICPEHYSGILCERYSPPPTRPQLPFAFSTYSSSSLPPSFHFEQSTLDFVPEAGTQTQTPVFYQNPIEKSQGKLSKSKPSSAERTSTSTETTPTIMTRTTTTEMSPITATSTVARELNFKKHDKSQQTNKPISLYSPSTTTANSILESSMVFATNENPQQYPQRFSICAQLRPCANNGKCVDNDNALDGTPRFKCICRPEFTGVFCHIKLNRRPNACVFNLCLNSGECIPNPETNSFSCNCPPNFTGKYCELNSY